MTWRIVLALSVVLASCRPSPLDPLYTTPDNWIFFRTGSADGIEAMRCDGSAALHINTPLSEDSIAGARLVGDFLVITIPDVGGWTAWALRRGGDGFEPLYLGDNVRLGGPRLEAFRKPAAVRQYWLVFGRSYAAFDGDGDGDGGGGGVDAISYFDLRTKAQSYDFLGRRDDMPDVKLVFTTLGPTQLATYFHSPSGALGSETLWVGKVLSSELGTEFPMTAPQQLAGLGDSAIAVLADGHVRVIDPMGALLWSVDRATAVDAIYATGDGSLAFASGGDIYCIAPGGGDPTRLASGELL